jgi:hypothetical protein
MRYTGGDSRSGSGQPSPLGGHGRRARHRAAYPDRVPLGKQPVPLARVARPARRHEVRQVVGATPGKRPDVVDAGLRVAAVHARTRLSDGRVHLGWQSTPPTAATDQPPTASAGPSRHPAGVAPRVSTAARLERRPARADAQAARARSTVERAPGIRAAREPASAASRAVITLEDAPAALTEAPRVTHDRSLASGSDNPRASRGSGLLGSNRYLAPPLVRAFPTRRRPLPPDRGARPAARGHPAQAARALPPGTGTRPRRPVPAPATARRHPWPRPAR